MGVVVKYKGSTIANMSTDGTKTLKTAGKYCEGDIGVEYSAPTPTLITKQITENGTYTAKEEGADGYSEVTINVPDQSKDTLNSLIDRSITTITSNVTSIGSYAFYYYTTLTEVNFPKATSIGNDAFYNCTALTALTEANFPELKGIWGYAFSGCTALTEANFPKVESIGTGAFYGCTALTEANFPELKGIGYGAFSGCTALTEVNFPKVTSIGDHAFSGCKALTEVNFPKVRNIGDYAFQNCTGLRYFDMSEVDGVPQIRSNTFANTTCIFLFRDQTQLDEYASATNWSTLTNRFQIKEATP